MDLAEQVCSKFPDFACSYNLFNSLIIFIACRLKLCLVYSKTKILLYTPCKLLHHLFIIHLGCNLPRICCPPAARKFLSATQAGMRSLDRPLWSCFWVLGWTAHSLNKSPYCKYNFFPLLTEIISNLFFLFKKQPTMIKHIHHAPTRIPKLITIFTQILSASGFIADGSAISTEFFTVVALLISIVTGNMLFCRN